MDNENNFNKGFSPADMVELFGMSKKTWERAMQVLIDNGFVVLILTRSDVWTYDYNYQLYHYDDSYDFDLHYSGSPLSDLQLRILFSQI